MAISILITSSRIRDNIWNSAMLNSWFQFFYFLLRWEPAKTKTFEIWNFESISGPKIVKGSALKTEFKKVTEIGIETTEMWSEIKALLKNFDQKLKISK